MPDRLGGSAPLPSNRVAIAAVLLATTFSACYAATVLPAYLSDPRNGLESLLLYGKLTAEIVFSFPAATMAMVALVYLFQRRGADTAGTPAEPREPDTPTPTVAVVYLCCGDLDHQALESLRGLRAPGRLLLVLHDDLAGGDPAVDRLRPSLEADPRFELLLLNRPEKTGGKPGALNYVLGELEGIADFTLICDNDSVAVDPDCIHRLLERLRDPSIAIAQARNVSVADASHCGVNRVLSRAIDVFHLFLSVAQRHGWTPFVGHNGLLRNEAVRAVGGYTPGCFADDIDLTVRLNLAGYRVAYASDVPFGERHPPSYAAFRIRTYKWALGSMQVLRRHLWTILTTNRLRFAEKWGLLHFTGFYTLQTVLLGYVCALYLLGPFVLRDTHFDLRTTLIAGSVIPVLIFLPVIAFSLRHGRLRELPAFICTCWLGYGATDFPTARGSLHGLSRRERRWVPTNGIADNGLDPALLWEAGFGAALLLVPLLWFPMLLWSPLTVVIAAKFLFIPTMAVLYRDRHLPPLRPRWAPLATASALGAALLVLPGLGSVPPQDPPAVRVTGKTLALEDAPYKVKGVHYGPWRPGTGPGRSPFPSEEELAEDLAMIAALGANTVLAYDPPRTLLDVAWRHQLRVLVAGWLDWPQLGNDAFAGQQQALLDRVEALHDHPAVLGWMLGHEIPPWIVVQHGTAKVEGVLRGLYDEIRARDSRHFVTHANWPNTRTLDLSFLDVCAFNLYPLWPPEVVAMGYGNFISKVLQPIAGDRPLLITEFGVNSMEAGEDGQAQRTTECWTGLNAAGACGGFVFEFADEWWKNYSNPQLHGAWWDRTTVDDDHLQHDEDPEEHYGLVTGERRPKAAYQAVAAMFAATPAAGSPPVAGGDWSSAMTIVLVLLALATVSFFAALTRSRRRERTSPTVSQS